MNRRTACLLAASIASVAAAPPTEVDDRIDLLFFGSDRPHRLRVHARVGGRPVEAGWREWSANLFSWHDRDGDGVLRPAEAARVLPPYALSGLARGACVSGSFEPPKDLDADKDGHVTLDEFRGYLRRSELGPVNWGVTGSRAEAAARVNSNLWRYLDADGDGLLRRAELDAAAAKLSRLDANDDGVLTPDELDFSPEPVRANYRRLSGHLVANYYVNDLKSYDAGRPPMSLAGEVLARYDRNRDGRLSRREIGLGEEEFSAADPDRDGFLTSRELSAWLASGADETFTAKLGRLPEALDRLEELGLPMGRLAVAGRPTEVSDARTRTFGDTRLSLRAYRTGERLTCAFQAADYLSRHAHRADAAGHVRRERVEGDFTLPAVFAAADRDGDGVLTRGELAGFLSVVSAGCRAGLSVAVVDDGRDLFAALDADGDGKLSAKELRAAWASVAPLCRDRAAGLSPSDVPRRMALTLSAGMHGEARWEGSALETTPWAAEAIRAMTPRRKPAPPEWFARMDANGDGVISEREWLGTAEDFKAIDADGDGLISPAEARAFDAKRR